MWATNKHRHSIISQQKGFTIVELLIVIVVIGILAAIVIVAYNGIQGRARAASAQSALTGASKKLALYEVENPGTYPVAAGADGMTNLNALGVNGNSSVTYQYSANTATAPNTYCITATAGTTSYKLSNTTTTPQVGGCPGHGVGGVAAVINLATNPAATAYLSGTVGNMGWRTARWFGSGATGAYTLVTGAGDGPVAGVTTYARKTWSTVTPSNGNTGYENGTIDGITAGTTYAFSSYLRPSSGGKTSVRIKVYWADSGGTAVGSTGTGASLSPGAGAWTQLTYVGAAPAGATQARVISDVDTGIAWQVGERLDGTALMITEGSTVYGYADGSSANWAWSGAANNSTSSGPAL